MIILKKSMLNTCYNKFLINFFFLILLFPLKTFSENIVPYCEGKNLNYQKENFFNYNKDKIDFNKIKITIKNNEYKKWIENSFKAYADRASSSTKYLKKKYKKNYTANVKIIFDEQLTCNFDAKIKIHGDYIDHLSPTNNQSSLRVKLINGNIHGIEEFILFNPKSRNGINEIFINFFMSQMNFLSPQTAKLNVNVNGYKNDFIFQERINKNMLERNHLKESAIIKMDERIQYSLERDKNNLLLAKIDNLNWSLKNYDNFILSSKILSEINEIYIMSNAMNYYNFTKKNPEYLPIALTNHKKKFKEIDLFELASILFDGGHSLAKHNRVFYYDFYENQYVPILYDSQPKIFSNKIFKYKDLINEHTWGLFFVLTEEHIKKKKQFVKRFKKIKEDQNIINKINKLGIFINKKELKKIFDLIDKRVEAINKLPLIKEKEYQTIKEKILKKNILYLNKIDLSNKFNLIFYDPKKNTFSKCNFNKIDCSIVNIKNLFESKNINKKKVSYLQLNNGGKSFFIGNHYFLNQKNNSYKEIGFKIFNKSYSSKDNEVKFLYNDVIFNILEKEKKINFVGDVQKVVFLNSNLNNWEINHTSKKINTNVNNNKYNNFITGCLNIINSNLDNIKINIKDSKCEDGINIVSSFGNINSIDILNSKNDGVDLDFSKIKINNLNIKNSGNDCLDISFGEHFITNANLMNCGDKGISIGENSKFRSNKIYIKNSINGIVSKDSSLTTINNIFFEDIDKFCFAAYRKKNEFTGSFLLINNFYGDCKNKVFQQEGSILIK